MKFEIVPAHELSLAEQAQTFTDAFAGYLIGSIELDAAGLGRFLCGQGADLCYSRFVRTKAGELASFGYINRTGPISRLAGMGTMPAARRSGAAAFLLSHLLDEAKARADETMVLECFEQNAPALALYRRHKFKEVGRLFGWRAHGGRKDQRSNQLEKLPVLTASQMRTPSDYPELPWQISRFAVVKIPAARAFAFDGASVIVGGPTPEPVRIHGFFGHRDDDWNPFRNVLRAVLAKFPGTEFFAPQIFPEQFGAEIFEPLGFKRESLNQFLMRREL
jgi:ribosomal protein S18 acetylase RimI-like enzyme